MLCSPKIEDLIKEPRLPILNAQLAVHGGQYALNLTQGEHAPQETVARIVILLLVAQHCHAMVDAHRQLGVLSFKNPCQLNKICPATQVTGLGKVPIGEYVARTQMDKGRSAGIFSGQSHHIVVSPSR